MDSQLPRDPMDEFLRQSLGDYRPDPPDDMWDRINAGMGAPSSLPPAKAAPATAWLSVAAAVFVLVIAAAQYYYYNNKIKHLSSELLLLQQSQENGQQRAATATALSTDSTRAVELLAPRVAGSRVGGKKIADEQPAAVAAPPAHTQLAAGLEEQAAWRVLPLAAGQRKEETGGSSGLVSALPAVERIISSLDWLPRTRVRSLLSVGQSVILPHPTTDVVRRPMRVVGQWGMLRKELAVADIQPDENSPRPDRGSRVETDILQATARMAGLKGTAPLGARWRLSAGLSLMNTSVQAVHHSGFRVGDRNRGHRHHGNRPPRGEWDNDFDCSLPSLSGSVTVGLRVAQLQSGGPLNEEAMVDFRIYTSEEVTKLMLPVGIGYEFGKGRLSVMPELGLVAGMNLSESSRVTAVMIDQQNTYFDSNINPFLDEASNNSFSMDVMAAMAFNWQINARLSIGLQPMVMRSLKLNPADNQYQQTAWGGAVGLGYQL